MLIMGVDNLFSSKLLHFNFKWWKDFSSESLSILYFKYWTLEGGPIVWFWHLFGTPILKLKGISVRKDYCLRGISSQYRADVSLEQFDDDNKGLL